MNICVIGGAGYVGIVTGVGLSAIGHRVVNVDIDAKRIEYLKTGSSPIYENGIESLLKLNIDEGRLSFTTDLQEGISVSDVVIIAVGTPTDSDGQPDLSHVIQVAEDLLYHLDTYKVIVVKSTVPVGTVELIRSILSREKHEGINFDIVSNPEFLREGNGLFDFFYPDRIILGAYSEHAFEIMRSMYSPIIERQVDWDVVGKVPESTGNVPLLQTDIASAQMIKYASNAFLATRISFINEMAWLSERLSADIKDVALGMGYDGRIGHSYLQAGIGFGGPCLEKDLKALIGIGEANNYEPRLLRAVLDRNDGQVVEVVARLKNFVGYLLYQRVVAVFGLAFKGGTNDMRNSMALRVIDRLENEGAIVRSHDPLAIPDARALMPHRTFVEDPYDVVDHADVLLILTDSPEYVDLDYRTIKERMANPCVVDARNLLDGDLMRGIGFAYTGIGTSTRNRLSNQSEK